MIINTLSQSERAEAYNEALKLVFDYVKTHDLTQVPAGRIELDGERVFINVADAALKTKEEQKLEVHRAYLDVHIPLSGNETIGWAALADIAVESDAPFDETNDFALFTAPATSYFTLRPGEFCIVFPEDAHAPVIGEGTLRKAIAKVRL